MKNFIFILCTAALTIPALAHAERFILKNPTTPVVAKTIQTLKFGNDTYVVVEAPKFSNLLASFTEGSESVTEDMQIGLPADQVSSDVEQGRKAWHPDALKYSQLPQARDGHDIIVAVLDTGVDYKHPALKDHIWSNERECAAGANGLDNDGNGYKNDCHGYDFDAKDGDPMDGDQHGTHCAGIISSSVDPTTNSQGVAPGVKVMPVRIIGSEQKGFLSNAAAGIKYAVDNGARILSNSWRVYKSWEAFEPTDPNLAILRAAIEYAGQHGVIMVAASGNESLNMDTGFESDPLFPAGFTGLNNLFVVAASNLAGNMSSFSNYGLKYVSVAAPGEDIISTIPGGRFMSMSGTSMATPLVAGSIARGLSASFSNAEAMSRLMRTSNVSDSWSNKVRSGGVIDLTKYLGN